MTLIHDYLDNELIYLYDRYVACEHCENITEDVELCVNPYLYAKTLCEEEQYICGDCYLELKEKS